MISRDYCKTMTAYNRWLNERLYPLCASLSDEERKRDRGAFFKSIHGTLDHIWWADAAWLGRFMQRQFPRAKLGELNFPEFAALMKARVEMDLLITDWAAQVDERWLGEPYTWTSGIDGKARTMPSWICVVQMFNHQTHHRGQLTTLLAQMGLDFGATDLPLLPGLITEQA